MRDPTRGTTTGLSDRPKREGGEDLIKMKLKKQEEKSIPRLKWEKIGKD